MTDVASFRTAKIGSAVIGPLREERQQRVLNLIDQLRTVHGKGGKGR